MLTPDTQIPTHARGKVRALVKAHRAWPDFLIGTGKLSASIGNAELIAFALQHKDLTAQLEAVLGMTPVSTVETTVYIIERLLREFYSRQGSKPRIRRRMGRAA